MSESTDTIAIGVTSIEYDTCNPSIDIHEKEIKELEKTIQTQEGMIKKLNNKVERDHVYIADLYRRHNELNEKLIMHKITHIGIYMILSIILIMLILSIRGII